MVIRPFPFPFPFPYAVESSRRHGDCCVDLASSSMSYSLPSTTKKMAMGGFTSGNDAAPAVTRKRARAGETIPVHRTAAKRRQAVDDDDDDPVVLRRRRRGVVEDAGSNELRLRQLVMAKVAAAMAAKDEEVEQVHRLNGALVELLRRVWVEAKAWRDLAIRHEATAAMLRVELARALQTCSWAQRQPDEDDAESCCYGDNYGGRGEDEDEVKAGRCSI